ncbi:MAG: hypothetical protein EOP08_02165 [Proteobacteria bacterium]|nr:MAG: hypothetical protein EOP08_02165 [Pseudomonadota bacterium]
MALFPLAPSAPLRTLVLITCALVGACNSGLPAPTKNGPAPEYEDPGSGAGEADGGPAMNESFGEQTTALFQGEGGQALKACQTQAQSQGTFQGTVQVHVILKPDGTLVGAEPRNDSGLPPALVECLTRTLAGMHFPAPGGARNLSFDVPLRFVAPEENEADDAGSADAGAAAPKKAATPKTKTKAKP